MDGFKNTTRMRAFTSSADVARTAGQTVGRVQSFARGGSVRRFAEGGTVGGLDESFEHEAHENPNGNALVQRDAPGVTEELDKGGGRTPLRSGYAKGGAKKHFHVHKHYHATGGKITTKSRSYSAAEKAAERQVEGAGPMMKKGGMHINPKNKGKFTQKMTGSKKGHLTGKDVQRGLHSQSGETRKEANFARMARRHFEPLGHADGGHIHDETHIPSNYPDYATGGTIDALATGGTINPLATGGTINELGCGGAAYGGMATGGTRDRLAQGGVPGALGQLMARRGALPPRPGMRPPIGAVAPVLRARGGSAARSAAESALKRHVETPAPKGHRGLGRMLKGS